MKITAISPWFGSKRTLAKTIVDELGDHAAYWEPFCGSLAVLLNKPPAPSETVNDFHGELINLARCLKDAVTARALYEDLMRFVMHEDLFHEAADRARARGHTPAPDVACVDRAVDFMVCSWFGRNGVSGTKSYNQGFCVRYTKNGGNMATRWRSVVDSIPAWHDRIRCITILNRDAFDLFPRIDDADRTVIYCDPPYLVKGASYVHDFTDDDHQRLADELHRFKRTRVVISYYDHPRLEALYPTWTKRSVEVTKSLVNQFHRDQSDAAVKAPEVLLINGPSYVETGGLFE